jgi:hypothetical protein
MCCCTRCLRWRRWWGDSLERLIEAAKTANDELKTEPRGGLYTRLIILGSVFGGVLIGILLTYLTIDSFAYDRARTTVINELSGPDGTIGKLNEELKVVQQALQSEKADSKLALDRLATKEKELEQMLALAKEDLNRQLQTAQSNLEEAKASLELLSTERDELLDRVYEQNMKIGAAAAERDMLKAKIEEADSDVASLKTKIEEGERLRSAVAKGVEQPSVQPEVLNDSTEVIDNIEANPERNCVESMQSFEARENDAFDLCESGSEIVVTRVQLGIACCGADVAVDGQEQFQLLGERYALKNNCYLTLQRVMERDGEPVVQMRAGC